MDDMDQQFKELDPKHFPRILEHYQSNPERMKEQARNLWKANPDIKSLGSLLANLESDLQHINPPE